MDSQDKMRISLYLNKTLVKSADRMMKEYGYSSRNEFYSKAVENFIADVLLHDNKSIIGEKLGQAVKELSEDNARAISKGLFRYAVQLEMITRIISELASFKSDEVEEIRREAINNVRRTRGRVSFDEIINGYYHNET